MNDEDVTTITAPAYWASALVNGDYSGLQAEEDIPDLVALYRFLRREAPWEIVGTDTDPETGESCEAYFSWSYGLHGGTTTGGDLLHYIAHRVVLHPGRQLAQARAQLKDALARRRVARRLETAPA